MSVSGIACAFVCASVLGILPAFAQERLTGVWLTADKSSHVAFPPCGQEHCGKITWLREPIDTETGMPWHDGFNPEKPLRQRPLIGLAMFTPLRPAAEGIWKGELYNPLDGKTCTGRLQLLGPDQLQLRGCALAGLLCQTEVWTRVAP
jgi:uncharacterized protein (DUF2147 family)